MLAAEAREFGQAGGGIATLDDIGAVNSMEKILKCPVMFLGLSLPEHGYHAPNENYDWQQASGGMIAPFQLPSWGGPPMLAW